MQVQAVAHLLLFAGAKMGWNSGYIHVLLDKLRKYSWTMG